MSGVGSGPNCGITIVIVPPFTARPFASMLTVPEACPIRLGRPGANGNARQREVDMRLQHAGEVDARELFQIRTGKVESSASMRT